MAETLAGMMGKAFEFEERTNIKIISETLTGTIVVYVGGANWGPINVPTKVVDFTSTFGSPLTKSDNADFSGLAATYSLKYAPYCYFTRVSNGKEKKANLIATNLSKGAKFEGDYIDNIDNFAVRIVGGNTVKTVYAGSAATTLTPNNSFNIGFEVLDDSGLPVTVNKEVKLDATGFAVLQSNDLVALDENGDDAAINVINTENYGNFSVTSNNQINFTVDSIKYSFSKGIPSGSVSDELNPGLNDLVVVVDKSKFVDENDDILNASAGDDVGKLIACINSTTNSPFVNADLKEGIVDALEAYRTAIPAVPGMLNASWIQSTDSIDGTNNGSYSANTANKGAFDDLDEAKLFINDSGVTPAPSNSTFIKYIYNDGTDDYIVKCGMTDNAGTWEIDFDPNDYEIWNDATDAWTTSPQPAQSDDLKDIGVDNGKFIDFPLFVGFIKDVFEDVASGIAPITYTERLVYALNNLVVTVPTNGNTPLFSAVDDKVVQINSQLPGKAGSINISQFPQFSTTGNADGNVFSSLTATTFDTSIQEIAENLSVLYNNTTISDYPQPGDTFDYGIELGFDVNWATDNLVINTLGTGADKNFKLLATTPVNNIYKSIGLDIGNAAVGVSSAAASDCLSFVATYAGSEGNTIQFEASVTEEGFNYIDFYFQDSIVQSFINFSYTPYEADGVTRNQLFLGWMMVNDAAINSIVKIEVTEGRTEGFTPLDLNRIYQLSGGTSGIEEISNGKYNAALETYTNVDLYAFDIISVPGISTTSVQDQITKVCEERKDCYGIIDIPEVYAGIPELGASPQMSIMWHNGALPDSGRAEPLTSKYTAIYFPWISIPDGVAGTAETVWYPPSTRVIGAICGSDNINGNKVNAKAGSQTTTITNINALAQYVKEKDKQKMYDDTLDNNINCIAYTMADGYFIDGQKNTMRGGLALSRLNVLCTSLYIKKRIYSFSNRYFWQPLTDTVMKNLAADLKEVADYLVDNLAIKSDYSIIVDRSINTETIEVQKGLIGIIEWTPIRSIEKIKIISVINDAKIQVVLA